MVNKVYVNNTAKIVFEYEALLEVILSAIKKQEKLRLPCEVNLIIISDPKMRQLSQQYRGLDKSTDILSFPTNYKELQAQLGYNMLGDIYISYAHIAQQANAYNHSLKREWAYMFTHGVYHLLGYDHLKKNDATIMNHKVAIIMQQIGVNRNV